MSERLPPTKRLGPVRTAPNQPAILRERGIDGHPLYVGADAYRFHPYIGKYTYVNGMIFRVLSVIDKVTIEVKQA
jgi:hypothetical protein